MKQIKAAILDDENSNIEILKKILLDAKLPKLYGQPIILVMRENLLKLKKWMLFSWI